ncbi:MAG: 4Fe-4S binding protein [Firmicutes bacterium]|nr:4Fe-4S binding protein [Bacillota bacterium]
MSTKADSKPIISVTPDCKGCDHCTEICPTRAIQGQLGERHHIDYKNCVNCGQCLINCPFGAIADMTMVNQVKEALQDPNKYVVSQCAPAVRAALGEEFGMPVGTLVKGKMFAALRKLGVKQVYDTEFTADLTIMEEGTELIERILHGKGPLPQFTSCCPAWIKYAEDHYPKFFPYLSSAKSPQQMFGEFQQVRGFEAVRDATIDIKGTPVRVAIVHGLKNVEPLINDVMNGRSRYHFIEVMNCPGGCVNGGGQPIRHDLAI